jgi:DNA-binding transcriptional regulator YiaG
MSCRHRLQRARSRSRGSQAKRLGERLYEWRKKNDFSQSEAALQLQISKRTLQEWEQGRAQPRHLALEAINAMIKS